MNLRIKDILLVGISFVSLSLCAQAKTMYVTDSRKIPVRSGKGTAYRILNIIESNQQVELLQKDNQWSLVRLENGKEGWVNNRYLVNDPTSKIAFEDLSLKHTNLIKQTESLKADNEQLKIDNKWLKSKLAISKNSLNNKINNYEALKEDSTEFLSLKSKYERVSKEFNEKAIKNENLENKLSDLQSSYYLWLALSIIGILFVGFIIGHAVRRPRRKPTLM